MLQIMFLSFKFNNSWTNKVYKKKKITNLLSDERKMKVFFLLHFFLMRWWTLDENEVYCYISIYRLNKSSVSYIEPNSLDSIKKEWEQDDENCVYRRNRQKISCKIDAKQKKTLNNVSVGCLSYAARLPDMVVHKLNWDIKKNNDSTYKLRLQCIII